MVARALVLLPLPLAAREPDEVGTLVQQVHDVAVRELRRVAHALARHGLDARLVGLLRGRVGQHHAEAQLREEREPERVVLVHVERARNAHVAARGDLGRKGLVAEQTLALVLVEVRHVLGGIERARALLAAVARDEAAVLARGLVDAEVVHREQAVVAARLAAHGPVRGGQRLDLLQGEQGGTHRSGRGGGIQLGGAPRRGRLGGAGGVRSRLAVAVARQKRRAVGAHVAGDVGPHGVHLGKLLERAQHGVV